MSTQVEDCLAPSGFTLIFSPGLAKAVKNLGIPHPAEASIFINQVAFWLQSGYGHATTNGQKWIYNSYQQWTADQFTTLSQWQFGEMVRELQSVGIIEKTCYAHLYRNLTKGIPGWHPYLTSSWITLNIERLFHLTGCYPHSYTKHSKPLPDAEVASSTTANRNYNNRVLRSQELSINTENSLSTQDDSADLKEKEVEGKQKAELDFDPWNDELPESSNYTHVTEKNPQSLPTVSYEGASSAVSGVGLKKQIKQGLKPKIKANFGLGKTREIWEIAVGRPYSVFLNWWGDRKYKPQGGRWEADARGNAYAEFYNNPQKTTVVIFPEFLEYMRMVAQNCNQQLASGIKAILPSCFVQRPEANLENVQQLMVNIEQLVSQGAMVALPTNSVTPSCTQSMTFDVANDGKIVPLKEFITIAASKPELEVSAHEELLRVLETKQLSWRNAPILRDSIKRWVEKTNGIVIGENGPELEKLELGG